MPSYYDAGTDFGLNPGDAQDQNMNTSAMSFSNLASMFDPASWGQYGYTDSFFQPQGFGQERIDNAINPSFAPWMEDQGMSLKGNYGDNSNTLESNLMKGSTPIGKASLDMNDPVFGMATNMLMSLAIPGIGGALGMAPGMAANAVGGAVGGGFMSGMNGGSPLAGAVGGGLGGITSGFNPASAVGIQDKTLGNIFNRGVGGAVSAGVQGGNPIEGGLMSAGTTALNSLPQLFGASAPQTQGPALSSNPAENASYASDYTPQSHILDKYLNDSGDNNQSFAPPGSAGAAPSIMSMFNAPEQQTTQKTIQGTGGFSFPNAGQLGTFAGNHLGDIASMIYGAYNNRKQQQKLKEMMGGLSGLYDPSGKYATQLRSNLERRDAASGRRSDYSGRETQLMADLAGHNASLMPSMLNMQMQGNNLQNQMFSNVFKGLRDMGGVSALRGLFSNNPTTKYENPNYNNYDPSNIPGWGG